MQPISITCADGVELRGSLHGDETGAGPLVIIHPATAVPERLYWSFAAYLAEHGFLVFTYNYRGVGRGNRDTSHIRMRDWADFDASAVMDWALEQFPGRPLIAIGHSFGGHAIGLSDRSAHLTGAVLVASQAGTLRLISPARERARVALLIKVLAPAITRLWGYMPGRRLGMGEDLPAGVLREWSRWISLPNYFFDDASLAAPERFARYEGPLLAYGFDDDPWATAPAIDILLGHFRSATIERRQIAPDKTGSGPVGHLGFFRERHRDTLWRELAEWLASRGGSPQAQA